MVHTCIHCATRGQSATCAHTSLHFLDHRCIGAFCRCCTVAPRSPLLRMDSFGFLHMAICIPYRVSHGIRLRSFQDRVCPSLSHRTGESPPIARVAQVLCSNSITTNKYRKDEGGDNLSPRLVLVLTWHSFLGILQGLFPGPGQAATKGK